MMLRFERVYWSNLRALPLEEHEYEKLARLGLAVKTLMRSIDRGKKKSVTKVVRIRPLFNKFVVEIVNLAQQGIKKDDGKIQEQVVASIKDDIQRLHSQLQKLEEKIHGMGPYVTTATTTLYLGIMESAVTIMYEALLEAKRQAEASEHKEEPIRNRFLYSLWECLKRRSQLLHPVVKTTKDDFQFNSEDFMKSKKTSGTKKELNEAVDKVMAL